MAFYFVFSVDMYVIMLRLTIIQSLCTIIIIIKQVSPSFKIVVLFKAIIIKIHSTFLTIYHFIINDDPVLNIAIRFFFFFQRLLSALINTWNSQNLKKFYDTFQVIGFICTVQLQRLPMTCNAVWTSTSSPIIL